MFPTAYVVDAKGISRLYLRITLSVADVPLV